MILSQFATSSSRIQLLHDAAQIGKKVRGDTARFGLTLSCKSTLLAYDKSLEKLIAGPLAADDGPICQGTTATDLGIDTAGGKRRRASHRWKRIWEGRRRAKKVYRLCRTNHDGAKAHDDGHSSCSGLWSHGTGSLHRTGQRDVQKFENCCRVGETSCACCFHGSWVFRGKAVPQVAARVEQVSDWITMFNADTRRRIRKIWRAIAPTLANDPRRWSKATGPISATICLVPEAGRKPRSPGFWQSPDASAVLDGALFNKAQIVDSFSTDMEMQLWKQASGHSLSAGMEKGIITDFAKEARDHLIREKNFMAVRALDFPVCGAIDERN